MKKQMQSGGWWLLVLAMLISAVGFAQPKGSGKPISHSRFTKMLKRHVDAEGKVNYAALRKNVRSLNDYLEELSENAPAETWSKAEKMAYWINAYNAFTLKLVVDEQPVNSLKEAGPKAQIAFVNTPWDKTFFSIGGQQMSLNNIAHNILRKQFGYDPRFHFALSNGSLGGAPLRQEAYEAKTLDAQLDDQARRFVNDRNRNNVAANQLSPLFKWYSGDFRKSGRTRVDLINQYSEVKVNEGLDMEFKDFDWRLNGQ